MMARLKESRWVYILLSIVLAIVFWVYVRASVDPNGVTSIHNVRVETTGTSVLASQGLIISDISPQMVELPVEGPTSARAELLRNRSGLCVRVDVSSCSEGENTLRYREVWPEGINSDDLTAKTSTLVVTVEKLYTKSFDVQFQLNGRVAQGYQMGTPAIEPVSVVVGGPVEQVNQVDKVADILESGELSERFAGDLPLVLLDKQGNSLTNLEVTLSTNTAYVVVPVVVVKEVPLTVNLVPGGGAAVDDAKQEIDPPSIVVSGAEADMAGLEEISLGSINLSNVEGTKPFTFPITLDPSLTNESGLTTATVTVTVEGLDTEVFAVSNIRTTPPPSGYEADVVTQSVLVTVRGPAEDLDKVDASQIRIVADLSNVTTLGTSVVPVRVYLDGGKYEQISEDPYGSKCNCEKNYSGGGGGGLSSASDGVRPALRRRLRRLLRQAAPGDSGPGLQRDRGQARRLCGGGTGQRRQLQHLSGGVSSALRGSGPGLRPGDGGAPPQRDHRSGDGLPGTGRGVCARPSDGPGHHPEERPGVCHFEAAALRTDGCSAMCAPSVRS